MSQPPGLRPISRPRSLPRYPLQPFSPTMSSRFFVFGALNGALSVALGAFGAHALQPRLTPRDLEIFETAVRYHGLHALALLVVGLLLALRPEPRSANPDPAPTPSAPGNAPDRMPSPAPRSTRTTSMIVASGWAFSVGIVFFPGALYVLSLAGWRWMGAIAPLGGTAFLAGWILLALGGGGALRR